MQTESKTHSDHAIDVYGLVAVVVNLDAPPEDVSERIPLKIPEEVSLDGTRQRGGAEHVLFVLDFACCRINKERDLREETNIEEEVTYAWWKSQTVSIRIPSYIRACISLVSKR